MQGPLRLSDPLLDHRAPAISIDKGLSQTDKGLTQAILVKYDPPPKVNKGVNT